MKILRRLLLVPIRKNHAAVEPEAECSKKKGGNKKSKSKSVEKKPVEQPVKTNSKPKWTIARPLPVQTAQGSMDQADEMPRISMTMSMEELQEEALARGIERQYLPTEKGDLLDFLVDGSIHLKNTKAWKDVERLRSRMRRDCLRIEEERLSTTKDTTCSNTASVSQSQSDSDRCTDGQLMSDIRTDFDIPGPVVTFSDRDQSHLSSLASTLPSRHIFRSFRDKRRDQSITMDRDRSGLSTILRRDQSFQTANEDSGMVALLSFIPISCGIPVCSGGGRKVSRTKAIEISNAKSDRRKQQEMNEVMERRQHEKEEREKESKEMSRKWDARAQFEPWIVSPPQNNQKQNGSMKKGFTVWCSISSDMMEHPAKQFDTTYKNLSDANDRARYLFYWRNPWRLASNKMVELVLIKSDNSGNNDCASTFHCVHPNGDKWIVSVVHDSTFKYLDNASTTRHAFDQE